MQQTEKIKLEDLKNRIKDAILYDETPLELTESDDGKNLRQIFAEHCVKIIDEVSLFIQPEGE